MSPFRGIGGFILKPTGFSKPSRKNPNWCRICFEEGPLGGAEVATGVLFADIRGYTSYSESRAAEEVARLLNRFYSLATRLIADQDGVIDKLVGDQVMALWLPGFAGRDTYLKKMVDCAEALLRAVGYPGGEPWLPLGLGVDHGVAFVGNVGEGEVKDFTALGDVVNTAARLQAAARPGQIVMSERVYEHVSSHYPTATAMRFDLKGKAETVDARIIDLTPVA